MSAVGEFLGSSPAFLLVCMGVSAMVGLLHLSMARRPWDESWWAAAWALLACLFLGARGVQLTTTDPDAALVAGKVAISLGPYLVWAIIGLGRNLNGVALGARHSTVLGAVSVAWTAAVFGTPWIVEPWVTTRTDLFGVEHYSVHARPPVVLLSVYIGGALAWGIRRIRKRSRLAPNERRVLIAGLGTYALLGVAAILTTLGVLKLPAMVEYGPFVVALCLCHLLVQRRRRVERQLEQVLAEQSHRLAESEERYRDLVHHAPLGVFVCGPKGDISTINPCMAEMLGGLGSGPWAVESAAVETPAGMDLLATVDRVRETGEVFRGEHRLPAREPGLERIWQVTASPIGSPTDDARSVLVLADDTTERSRLERQLRQAQKMESVGQLAAGIAHEINNPMAYVSANLRAMAESWEELRKRAGEEPRVRSELAELETLIQDSTEGVDRAIAIVRDVREFAHAGGEEAGAVADLGEILGSCVRFASIAGVRGVAIHPHVEEPLRVPGASGPLRQVFLNLLVNALQAVPSGGNVWLEARREGRRAIVAVHDDGPGIAEELASRVFDPFFTTKGVGEGTGLGLYISYQIVLNHDGDIRVGAGPHGGACFEVSLPLADA